jgi:chemotaxis protein methyltransferase CheR
MNGAERGELERLRDAVSDLIGFGFEADRIVQLGVALWPRVQELGLSGFDAYISRLRAPEHRAAETTAVGSLLTVTETYFHRSYDQIVAFLDQVAEPAARSSRRLRILSAGCASGEEPYTLAIALRERFPDIERWDVEIVGFDLNALMLKKAEEGRYSAWSLRALPPELKKTSFCPRLAPWSSFSIRTWSSRESGLLRVSRPTRSSVAMS